VLVGSLPGAGGDDPDLIQRQPALLQLAHAAGKGRAALRDGGLDGNWLGQ